MGLRPHPQSLPFVGEGSRSRVRDIVPSPNYLRELRREHRKYPTKAEAILWEHLRDRRLAGAKFRRQKSIGRYIADFYCAEHRLIIELDGGVHRMQLEYDQLRQAELEAQGYIVLRFSNKQIMNDLEGVLREIEKALK